MGRDIYFEMKQNNSLNFHEEEFDFDFMLKQEGTLPTGVIITEFMNQGTL